MSSRSGSRARAWANSRRKHLTNKARLTVQMPVAVGDARLGLDLDGKARIMDAALETAIAFPGRGQQLKMELERAKSVSDPRERAKLVVIALVNIAAPDVRVLRRCARGIVPSFK